MRTRRSQSSSDPMPPLDFARGKPPQSASKEVHRAVLLHEALAQLEIRLDDVVVDATLGGAGHARAIAERLGTHGTLVGFDLDPDAILRARDALKSLPAQAGAQPAVHLVNANFRKMTEELHTLGLPAQTGVPRITKALFDLGWSSYQLDSGRGFSFLRDEPLEMTYGKGAGLTAKMIVNEWAEASIADILYGWGEEHYSRRIAKAIVEARHKRPIETARDLADIVKAATPPRYRFGRIHPATKTFQALRIAVNDELGSLADGLRAAWESLAPGGRIAVITFHSIEDRLVKQAFVEREKAGEGKRTTKKPIVPTAAEVVANPRARSAKLRVLEKNPAYKDIHRTF